LVPFETARKSGFKLGQPAPPQRSRPRQQGAPENATERGTVAGADRGCSSRLKNPRLGRQGRRTWFETIEEMQAVLDDYLVGYNQRRPHQGRGMNGRTPATAFVEGLPKPQQQKDEKRPEKRATKQAA
jgi:hypothetical protein